MLYSSDATHWAVSSGCKRTAPGGGKIGRARPAADAPSVEMFPHDERSARGFRAAPTTQPERRDPRAHCLLRMARNSASRVRTIPPPLRYVGYVLCDPHGYIWRWPHCVRRGWATCMLRAQVSPYSTHPTHGTLYTLTLITLLLVFVGANCAHDLATVSPLLGEQMKSVTVSAYQ